MWKDVLGEVWGSVFGVGGEVLEVCWDRAVFPKVGSTEFWGSIKESKGFHEQMSCYPVF